MSHSWLHRCDRSRLPERESGTKRREKALFVPLQPGQKRYEAVSEAALTRRSSSEGAQSGTKFLKRDFLSHFFQNLAFEMSKRHEKQNRHRINVPKAAILCGPPGGEGAVKRSLSNIFIYRFRFPANPHFLNKVSRTIQFLFKIMLILRRPAQAPGQSMTRTVVAGRCPGIVFARHLPPVNR